MFTIFVNDESHTLPTDFDPTKSLANFLRCDLALTGTKIACNEGGCGSCTILFTSPQNPTPVAVNACLKLLSSCNNCHILTIEGLGASNKTFSDVQRAIADGNGSQCGFCTPGWVMACCGFLLSDLPKTPQNMEKFFDGNLCRCTGYRPIIQSFMRLLKGAQDGCTGKCETCNASDQHEHSQVESTDVTECCGSGTCGVSDLEDIMKKDGIASKHNTKKILRIADNLREFFQPVNLRSALELVKATDKKNLSINAGHTGKGGVEKYYNGTAPYHRPVESNVIIDISCISELQRITSCGTYTTVGSGVTLNKLIKHFCASEFAPFNAASRHISMVANNQVRNAGTWGGNIMLAQKFPKFPSDILLCLSALSATVTFATFEGEIVPNVPIVQFCKEGHFKENCALLLSFSVQKKQGNWVARRFKLMQRAQNAHAHASLFVVANIHDNMKISDVVVVVGGATDVIEVCKKTAALMEDTDIDDNDGISNVLDIFLEEMNELTVNEEEDLTKKEYRTLAARNCLLKFYFFLNKKEGRDESLSYKLGGKGVQEFSINVNSLPVTAPIPKIGSRLQASGEAMYTQDYASMTDPRFSLHGALVFAKEVGKIIKAIDYTKARELGMVDFVDARDLKYDKKIMDDEVLFLAIGDVVPSVGYPVALVLFKNEKEGLNIAAAVDIKYGDKIEANMSPVFSLADAMRYNRVTLDEDKNPRLVKGNINDGLEMSPIRLNGMTTTGGQKHFYFETQAAVCSVSEGGQVELRSSTQNLTRTQATIGKLLGVGSSKVVVKQLRAGGGFGGKLTRNLQTSGSAALAASKTGRTCSVVNDRGMDLQLIGGRESIIIEYDIGFNKEGKILAAKFVIHAESGATLDESADSLGMSILWMDHVYNVDNFLCEGILYKTDISTNTSCRSPGNMQSNFVYEDLIWRIAKKVGKSVRDVQELNFYCKGNTLPTTFRGISLGRLSECNLQRCWQELHKKGKVIEKELDLDLFNETNLWKKRGMACMPVKYGITGSGYKQQVRILIYADGTVRVGTSGVEIGQGLATKVVQCVGMRLGVDMEKIEVHESDTSNNSTNAGATGGSATSEVCCQAALNGCDILLQRLKKSTGYEVTGASNLSFEDAVSAADDAGVCLCADGWSNPESVDQFQYFVWVATCVVVELDVLTGEIVVLSADIQYDCGEQLNADIDIGQIEGGFVMGLGYFLSEKVVFDQATGYLKSAGTWDYKPPGLLDIPREFNVRLLRDIGNNVKGNVLRSKAVGEPPMVSSAAAWFAVRAAVLAAGGSMNLSCPCTVDERLLAIHRR